MNATLVLGLINSIASKIIEVSLLLLGLLFFQINQECLQGIVLEYLVSLKLGSALRALMLSIDTF
jgi:hypothetical protein